MNQPKGSKPLGIGIYDNRAQLDHNTEAFLREWLKRFQLDGVSRREARASIARVLKHRV